jgi:ankyrin repeat protein
MSINLLSYEAVKIVVECAYNYLQNVPKGDDSFFLAQDQDGNTALHLAMKKKREPLGWNLLSAYKDTLKAKGCSLSTVRQKVAALVNAQDRQGRTILYYLPLNYDLPIYIHRYAAENAGNVNVVDNEGNRPACVVFGNFVREFPDCSMYEAFECARTFVINGANPDQPNENGETIINLAQKNIKAWTVEATEDLRLAYFMSLKRKIRQELNHDPQALDKSVILTSDVLVNTPKVDQFVNNEIVLAKKLSEVIECSTLKEFRQRIKENPASLVQRNELGLTFWHYIAGLSSFDYQKIKIAASLAWQYQKAIQDRNCFFETRDVYGDTVILIAIKKGLNAHAQYLLSVYEEVLEEAGLDQAQVRKQIRAIVNMADRDGKSVMHNLFFESEKVLDTAKFFTAKGANLNLADNNGNRPHECWCCFIKDSHEKGEAIAVNSAMQFARFYVENGINPDWLSREDETIITIVQKYCSGWEEQHTIKLRQLYQKYLKKQSITQTAKDHNAQDIDEREDLTSTSNKRISELAIQFSGNPAVRTRELDELFAAIERYDRDRVAILIEENPTILTRTNELGWNCWHLIGNDPHLGLLVIGTVVECAVRHLNRVLKEHDSFFLARTSNGDTALQIAIKNKRNEHAKFLLTTYEEALIKECHDKGLPRTLVEQKLSTLINMRDLNGRTIMHNIHINYMYPYFKSLQFFIAKGADIYSADNEGNLASHIIYGNFIKDGCKWYNFKSYEVFCYGRLYARNNINPDLANTAGETLISIAKKYVKDWTEEDSEELRLIYLASLRRSLYKEEVTEEKAETPAASIAGKTPERVNTVPVIEINRARTVYGQDFSMLFNAIEWKNLPCLYQLIKKKPAALNNELKDEDNTYVSDNIIERTEEKLPIVASWVRKYLKTCPGGYDRFFLTCDDKGNTALQIAMKKGHQGLAEFLLSVYEQVLTDDGLTPTQIQEKVAAYVNIPDHKGRTIMHNLDYEREGVLNTAEFFIAKGANLELVDAKGNKSYDYLSNFLKRSHAKGKAFDALATLDLVRVYVEHGVNPDQEKRGGKTLIRIAQRYSTSWSEKHNALLRLLYQFNVNPSQVQPYTST